jgi:hypothetical protein
MVAGQDLVSAIDGAGEDGVLIAEPVPSHLGRQ